MYQFEFKQSFSLEEKRDFVEYMELTLRTESYLTILTDSHESAICLSNILEYRHARNNIAVVHICGSTLRAFADPCGERSLMMAVIIKSR